MTRIRGEQGVRVKRAGLIVSDVACVTEFLACERSRVKNILENRTDCLSVCV